MTTVGIIGAGQIGSALARAFIGLGHQVVIANSRTPESLEPLIAELGPQARAATASEAGEAGEFVVVTVPFKAVHDIPVEPLAGKIVIDTNNYYWERDGHVDAIDAGTETPSGVLQAHLPTSLVVKAFNHIRYDHITSDGFPPGDPRRRALGVSSNDPDAAAFVAELQNQLGFDTVDVSPLSESWRVDRDRPAYGSRQTADEMVANLTKAQRVL